MNSISSEFSHPDTLASGFLPEVVGLATLEEYEYLTTAQSMLPDTDVHMSDANDEQASLHDEYQQSMFDLPFTTTAFFPDLFTTTAASQDDIVMKDSIANPACDNSRFEKSSDNSANKGKNIYNFLHMKKAAKSTVQDQKQSKLATNVAMALSTIVVGPATDIPFSSLNSNKALPKVTAAIMIDHAAKLRRIRIRRRLPKAKASSKSPTHNLDTIPPEIRDHIFSFVLTSPNPISLEKISLPGVCFLTREIYADTAPIYFATNTFETHLHMPHTFEEALDPAEYHKAYKPATLCSRHLKYLEKNVFWFKNDFAVRKVKFEILDKDGAHFAGLEFEVSKRGAGSVKVLCNEGPEPVADTEKDMCRNMKYVDRCSALAVAELSNPKSYRAILEPLLTSMSARENFKGLTVGDLKELAEKVVVPYKSEKEKITEE